MKKSILLTLLLLFGSIFQIQAWQLVGPADIVATNICFAELPYSGTMICTNDGMYLFNENNYQWDYFTDAGLPVIEGIFMDTENILLIMGNGSYSDGIYNFNRNTGQFSVVEYCAEPTFLKFDHNASIYYVGYSTGLLVSEDGATWEENSYFSSKNCLDLSINYTNLVVSVNELPPNTYWSNDSGTSWHNSSTFSAIHRISSYYSSHFFGTCPLNTPLSGLYYSDDGGNNWDLEFSSYYMSDVSYDPNGYLIVAWNNPGTGYEGIATYEQGGGTASLTFLNEGLPSAHINRVKQQEGIDVHFAYVCTDMGVYNYVFVGVEEISKPEFTLSPNPAKSNESVHLHFGENVYIKSIQIQNLSGELVDERFLGKPVVDLMISVDDLSAGVYLVNVITREGSKQRKIVVK